MIGVLASNIDIHRDLRVSLSNKSNSSINSKNSNNNNKNKNTNHRPIDTIDDDDDLNFFLLYDVVFVDAIFDSTRIKDLGKLLPLLPLIPLYYN